MLNEKEKHYQDMIVRLNKALASSGLSIPDIVKRIGVTDKGVRKWFETGRIASKRIKPLADILGCDAIWLAMGETPTMVREHTPEYLTERDIMIPVKDIELSAGNGTSAPEFVNTKKELPFDAEWLRKHGLKAKNLMVNYVRGDSMEPTMNDGDSILIDTSRTNIIDRNIYAIVLGGDLKVKRLVQKFNGSIEVISDNPMHETEIISGSDLEYLHIIGEAVYRSGML
ncbi:MAG: hypothetical protein OQK29_01320 [Ignavibacteriaceae bacterium]|nr:hypothetical protein [Ignavibacteriaceae bacterium]